MARKATVYRGTLYCQRTYKTGVDMQAAGPESPEPVTAPGGAVSQIQSAVQANLMVAPVCETVDHSSEFMP